MLWLVVFLLLSYKSLRLCFVFFFSVCLFSFCCSDWVNSIDLLSSSLILFSFTSLLLFSPSSKFFFFLNVWHFILQFFKFHLVLFCKFHFFAEVFSFFICFKGICNWCWITFVWLLSSLYQIIPTSYSSPSWCQLIVFLIQVVIFLILSMMSNFLLYSGHCFYYVRGI